MDIQDTEKTGKNMLGTPTSPIDVYEYFRDLHSSLICQGIGNYAENEPCCVGAHLSCIFDVYSSHDTWARNDFCSGAFAWTELVVKPLGGNILHAQALLQDAGAGDNPFGSETWPIPPVEVFHRLMKVEKLPDLTGRDNIDWIQPEEVQ